MDNILGVVYGFERFAVGTLLIGIFFFNDPASFWRLFSAFLVVAGIIGIKIAS